MVKNTTTNHQLVLCVCVLLLHNHTHMNLAACGVPIMLHLNIISISSSQPITQLLPMDSSNQLCNHTTAEFLAKSTNSEQEPKLCVSVFQIKYLMMSVSSVAELWWPYIKKNYCVYLFILHLMGTLQTKIKGKVRGKSLQKAMKAKLM